MTENKAMPFENTIPFKVTCPDCGHTWECNAKGRRIPCGICGRTFKNPSNPYINKPKKPKFEVVCSACNIQFLTESKRYRISCPNCGAWVINENADYKPTR